jgi:hypothetical protein
MLAAKINRFAVHAFACFSLPGRNREANACAFCTFRAFCVEFLTRLITAARRVGKPRGQPGIR